MPEHIIGKCPWCERHNVELYLVVGCTQDGPFALYICTRCKDILKEIVVKPDE